MGVNGPTWRSPWAAVRRFRRQGLGPLLKIGGAGAGGVVRAEEGEGDGAGGRRAGAGEPVTVAVSEIGLPTMTVGVASVTMVASPGSTTEVSLASLQELVTAG